MARAVRRRRRALYVSSPIGLGHAWRDVAIARELRALHPDLEIDWLAQDPVTRVLEALRRAHPPGQRASWPTSRAHIAAESREHELHVFQAFRRMDEILLANFMVFHDVVRDEPYDLWIGDEAWELDYYLHENPELKRAPYAFLTDFVGWLPMPEGGDREASLTADYNAEMIEQIARFPRVRDRALFVGAPDDVVPGTFGDGLPRIRPWIEAHFDFSGYVLAVDAGRARRSRRAARRARLRRPDERVCIVAVRRLGRRRQPARRVIAGPRRRASACRALRMIVVCGPRIDPASLPAGRRHRGRRLRPRPLPAPGGLRRRASTQGGLTTCMELAAAGRPFVYVPLRAPLRAEPARAPPPGALRRRATRWTSPTATPGDDRRAIVRAARRAGRPAPVERDGAARAAALIAELL